MKYIPHYMMLFDILYICSAILRNLNKIYNTKARTKMCEHIRTLVRSNFINKPLKTLNGPLCVYDCTYTTWCPVKMCRFAENTMQQHIFAHLLYNEGVKSRSNMTE